MEDGNLKKRGTLEGPEEQHPNAESMAKSQEANQGGLISNSQASQDENIETREGQKMSEIKALMAAKHAIPAEDQDDPQKMGQHYTQMAEKCKQNGLNSKALQDSSKWFNLGSKEASPKSYLDFDTPLANGAVRLGVFRLTDSDSEGLTSLTHQATQNILDCLPEGVVYHANDKEHYHVTVQMISHPSDPRPDAFREGGGLTHSLDHHWIPGPLASNLKRERDIYENLGAKHGPPHLTAHSIILADSGALLLLFTDSSGTVKQLREELKEALPGSNEKQPTIIHVTLARLLRAELSLEQVGNLTERCAKSTESLRGKSFTPSALWHVVEKTFTYVNVDEDSYKCPFKSV